MLAICHSSDKKRYICIRPGTPLGPEGARPGAAIKDSQEEVALVAAMSDLQHVPKTHTIKVALGPTQAVSHPPQTDPGTNTALGGLTMGLRGQQADWLAAPFCSPLVSEHGWDKAGQDVGRLQWETLAPGLPLHLDKDFLR